MKRFPLEIRGAVAGAITALGVLLATFTAGAIYRALLEQGQNPQPGTRPPTTESLTAKGRSFYVQSCAHCHGRDADGGEDAPSLLKLEISPAHMTLVIQSGIQGEMPSFAKKFKSEDTAAIVAYLKTLH